MVSSKRPERNEMSANRQPAQIPWGTDIGARGYSASLEPPVRRRFAARMVGCKRLLRRRGAQRSRSERTRSVASRLGALYPCARLGALCFSGNASQRRAVEQDDPSPAPGDEARPLEPTQMQIGSLARRPGQCRELRLC